MSQFDLSRLADWAHLPFFKNDLPGIAAKLASESRPVFPPAPQVFTALERTQPNDVKVVILGQDPYPQNGKGHGLAFSILNSFPPRPRRDSLHNILDELAQDIGTTRHATDLGDWAKQGVLLLNALSLTVLEGEPRKHRTLGWQKLTAQVLGHLSGRPRAYLLWGKDAHEAAARICPTTNFKLCSSHPSPMSVGKKGTRFVAFKGSRPFSRTNAWLQAQGMSAINWA